MGVFTTAVMITLLATIAILVFGVVAMSRGGEFDRQHSVQLMFTRIGFQALVIFLIIAAALYAASVA